MSANSTALIILAAGLGRRFGSEDKLAQTLNGRPLGHHILDRVTQIDWAQKILVCREEATWVSAYEANEFILARNKTPERGLAQSLHIGVNNLKNISHFCIFLADMPLIPLEHLQTLLSASSREPHRVIASHSADYLGPPAIFPISEAEHIPKEGDKGARDLLRGAIKLPVAEKYLSDVDTPADLAWLEATEFDRLD